MQINDGTQDESARTLPTRSLYRLLRWAYPAFRMMFPNLVIQSDDLARAMVDVALQRTGEGQTCVFENRDIRVLVDAFALA
jgi:hypothetical protein